MPAPESIKQLVDKFKENREAYRSGKYNEAQLRQQFLDPFFEALGWDIYNRAGVSPEYQDVKIEDSLRIDGASKAPDYTFRIGKERKFYVEAKKPAVDIQYDIHPAYQLKRYAWNAHLPLSILTDFEEFAVYNCKNKPNPSDSAATGRDLFYKYTDYVEKWDEIAAIFSREAVWKGSFDRYAETSKGKKGTTEVDDAILESIESWRKLLALNIALRNEQVREEGQLNFAVQMTIDRILFLRICEDRGIEPEEQFKSMLEKPGIYAQMVELFKRADMKYNSGLFHFTEEKGTSAADTFTPGLTVDDKVLKEIVKDIYYPCPYIFKEIPVEILGQVYEQFLGRVIHLTAGHQARIEEKPEVRKAGGVYYTPKYIVDYIVANTVGKLLEGKTPNDAAELKIVDPACGSGSFLLGAYQYLLDWHLKWYLADGAEKWSKGKAPALIASEKGSFKLTTARKKEILVNSIHGVDIDAQAVEVTKLSLLLKVLEEETGQLSLGLERALPDLGRNIQCGNSLIGQDYFAGQLIVDENERRRVNPFDWESAFPAVFASGAKGGFDAVIGNPPWGYEFCRKDENYLRNHYIVAKTPSLDSYAIFIEIAYKILGINCILGFITPDTFLRKNELLPIRSFLLNETSISELIETGPVFSQVRDTWCLVFFVRKPYSEDNKIIHRQLSRYITSSEDRLNLFGQGNWSKVSTVAQKVWINNPDMIIGYLPDEIAQGIVKKMEGWPSLGTLTNIYKISRGEEGSKFALKIDETGESLMVIPKDVERYHVDDGLRVCTKSLTSTKNISFYTHPKIWIIRIQKMRWKQRIVCSYDERRNSAGMKTLQVIVSVNDNPIYLKFLLSIIASKLINFWCVNYLADDMNQSYLSRIPIRTIDFSKPAEVKQHDRMVALVERMLDLHKRTPTTPQEQERLTREIDSTDREIDRLVYELYGLTDDEIKIVESTS